MFEKEIKILDVNVEEAEKKLLSMGAEFVFNTKQKIYTYDLPTISHRLSEAIDILKSQPNPLVAYAYKQKLKTILLEISDDLAVRKYGKVYEDVAHYRKAQQLKEAALRKTLGYGQDSNGVLKEELGVKFIPMEKCIEILQTYGIYWVENMSDDELDKKYKKQAKKYHPDLLTDAPNKDNNEKFQELANAVNTLKKYIKARNARYKRR